MLIAMIAGHLFALHGVGRYVFDIAIWFLVAALLALPLAVASAVANWIATFEQDVEEGSLKIALALGLYFLLVSLLFVTESVVSLAAALVRRFRNG